ncbi:MAG: phosphoribosylamine--glycine ligase [Gemmatimonadetes bacterium]|nr:phosphoribosylamine--glycine ligase [Gemmatimonadota bacterium]
MRILLLGGGGREHAIGWKLAQDNPSVDLIAAPGNPGLEELGRCVRINPSDPDAVCEVAERERPDLVVVGPEAPLAAGVSDALRARGFAVFGPSLAAAQLESSKRFAKEVMLEHGVPTAGASWHASSSEAIAAIRLTGAPVVVKASGLAAGKGVVVAASVSEAESAVHAMMDHGVHGAAGAEVLIEECLSGEELSVFALTDGVNFVLLPVAQDHKRLLDGDSGPNTGGMGAYAPVSLATPELLGTVSETIIAPTLSAMRKRGTPFQGLLYCGLMLTPSGPKVIEFNCRFGDPETQAVLPLLDGSLIDLMALSAAGRLHASADISATQGAAVTTVVAAPGYPEAPTLGSVITLPEAPRGTMVFHAGTRRREDGALVTAGGRVVGVTAVSGSFETACRASREHAGSIRFEGLQFRHDIGWRELARRARTT